MLLYSDIINNDSLHVIDFVLKVQNRLQIDWNTCRISNFNQSLKFFAQNVNPNLCWNII